MGDDGRISWEPAMRIQRENVRLRVFFTSVEKEGGIPAYEAFVRRAGRLGCRGATVFRGVEGTDARGRRLRPGALAPVQEVPVVVEVIDTAGRIDELLRRAAPTLRDRTVTRERATILVYRDRPEGNPRLPSAVALDEEFMPEEREGVLLRVFVNESDRWGRRPVVREIVDRAAAAGLAGAVVLKSPLGYGTHRRERSDKVEAASLGQPVVVELLDAEDRVRAFLPSLDLILHEGLVTIEKVRILRYGAGSPAANGGGEAASRS